jgi:hypothetical protein
MALLLHLAWMLLTLLHLGGVFLIFAGVALFGVYFIAGNARSADGRIPPSSWRGAGPRKGLRIVGAGVALLLAAVLIKMLMPDGS